MAARDQHRLRGWCRHASRGSGGNWIGLQRCGGASANDTCGVRLAGIPNRSASIGFRCGCTTVVRDAAPIRRSAIRSSLAGRCRSRCLLQANKTDLALFSKLQPWSVADRRLEQRFRFAPSIQTPPESRLGCHPSLRTTQNRQMGWRIASKPLAFCDCRACLHLTILERKLDLWIHRLSGPAWSNKI